VANSFRDYVIPISFSCDEFSGAYVARRVLLRLQPANFAEQALLARVLLKRPAQASDSLF
jgi:hypothetical protein